MHFPKIITNLIPIVSLDLSFGVWSYGAGFIDCGVSACRTAGVSSRGAIAIISAVASVGASVIAGISIITAVGIVVSVSSIGTVIAVARVSYHCHLASVLHTTS